MMRPRNLPSQTALAEVALMFLPALPAYLWLWPNVEGTAWRMPVQVVVYVYGLIFAVPLYLWRLYGRQRQK